MHKSSQALQKKLSEALSPHGSIGDFVKKTGFSRSGVEKWRDGESSPSIENLEKIAEALETDPWDLIKPANASDTDLRMRMKSETAAFVRREKELLEMLEASIGVGGKPGMTELLSLLSRLTTAQVQDYIRNLNAELGLKTSKVKK